MILQEASTLENPKFKSLYRILTLRYHPDNKKTGDIEMIKKLNAAAAEGDRSFGELLRHLEQKGVLQRINKNKEEPKEQQKEKNKEEMVDATTLNRLKKWLEVKAEEKKGYSIDIELVFSYGKPYFIIGITKRVGLKKYVFDFKALANDILSYPNRTIEESAEATINSALRIFEKGIS